MAEKDPLRAYNFRLLIEGRDAAGFTECSGFGTDVDVIAYREGGATARTRHLPGQTRFRPVTLRYGLSHARELWTWLQTSTTGTPIRRDCSVVMFESDGVSEAYRWTLFDSWIMNWRAAPLDAGSDEIAIDQMTIVFDRMERG